MARYAGSSGTDVIDAVDSLVLDLLEWVGPTSRQYAEVMEAWRTSCPRLPVWEEACGRGLLERHYDPGMGAFVTVTPLGQQYLAQYRPARPQPA